MEPSSKKRKQSEEEDNPWVSLPLIEHGQWMLVGLPTEKTAGDLLKHIFPDVWQTLVLEYIPDDLLVWKRLIILDRTDENTVWEAYPTETWYQSHCTLKRSRNKLKMDLNLTDRNGSLVQEARLRVPGEEEDVVLQRVHWTAMQSTLHACLQETYDRLTNLRNSQSLIIN